MYKYYAYARPVAPFTYPKENLISFKNYNKKTYIEEARRTVWGELVYSEPLTLDDLEEYEFVSSKNN